MREVLAHHPIPFPVLLGIFGALVGSFLNVVIVRLPLGQSIVSPPSHCPKCGYRIPPWLNIPIVSWLVLRGRCRNCGSPISARYPLVELLTALLFVAVGRRFGINPATVAGLILVSGLVVITFVDIDYWEIPDEISVWGTVVGCLLRPWAFDVPWWSGLAGAALGGGFLMIVRVSYELVRKQEGMGLGDIKLIAMIGAFLGVGSLLPVIFVASTMGSLYGVVALFMGGFSGQNPADEPAEASSPDAPPDAPAPEAPDSVDTAGNLPSRAQASNAEESPGDEEDDWTPPPYAVPFGPFLALGAITVLLLGPQIKQLLVMLRL